jgi:hypothetical protein
MYKPILNCNSKFEVSSPIRLYYLNYSGETQKFVYPHDDGLDVLTKQPVNKDQNVSLAPWDVLIIKEK